jgi:DNA polymerase-3 subunit alpha/error-prone DNA polymerase
LEETQKKKMLLEALGFDPEGEALSLFTGKRPELRIKDLNKRTGQTVDLVVRVMDARRKRVKGGLRYFFLFSDETGVIEGVGVKKCMSFGSPPACYVRSRVQKIGKGKAKLFNCTFTSCGL